MARRRADPKPTGTPEPKSSPESSDEFVKLPNGARAPRCQFVRRPERGSTRCKKAAMVGARFCRRHGGTLRKRIGPANSNWKGGISPMRPGRWTSRFPGPLQPQYIAALRDPDILSLESEIALIDVRLGELVQRTGRHAEWSEVKDAYEAQMAAVQSGDSAQIKASFERMAALAYGQVDNDAAWTALIRLTDRRRALVESERRRLVEQNMFLSREQAHAYGHAVLESITRHVKDRQTLIRVLGDLRAVLDAGRDSPGTGIPGGLALVGGRTGTD